MHFLTVFLGLTFRTLNSVGGFQERKVLGVGDALDEVQILRAEVLATIHNEDTRNVEFNVVAFLRGLEEIKGGTLRSMNNRLQRMYTHAYRL